MNNIVKVKVQIRGKRPLLQHKFGPEALPLEKGEKTGVAGNNPEEWKLTCMVTPEGQLYVNPTYIFGMMVNAAKHTKQGKGSLQAVVAATLQVEENRVLLSNRFLTGEPTTDAEQPVYLDVQGVRNPTTKGQNVRYRLAAKPGWECEFTLIWDKTIVNRDQMKAIMTDAGRFVGLADGRKIGYGRFDVVSFEEV